MSKIEKGRLDGVSGMRKFSAIEHFTIADDIEAQINSPNNTDDPKWLRRRAERVRRLAEQKQQSTEHKSRQ
ncbi:MAG TPA: hypothetical protein VMR74_12150 [Gammaproteobacteria bacterium]|nr:hypothetical protein [Gammaproteobacteria bacterium]